MVASAMLDFLDRQLCCSKFANLLVISPHEFNSHFAKAAIGCELKFNRGGKRRRQHFNISLIYPALILLVHFSNPPQIILYNILKIN